MRGGWRRRDWDPTTSLARSEVGVTGGAHPSARAGGGRWSRPSWVSGGPPGWWAGEPRGDTQLKEKRRGCIAGLMAEGPSGEVGLMGCRATEVASKHGGGVQGSLPGLGDWTANKQKEEGFCFLYKDSNNWIQISIWIHQNKNNAAACMQQTSSYLFIFRKQIMFLFFLYYIPCKELNVGKNLKIIGKSLFKFFSYSHIEIWKFQGVTSKLWPRSEGSSLFVVIGCRLNDIMIPCDTRKFHHNKIMLETWFSFYFPRINKLSNKFGSIYLNNI
jgi:hypothetical protein